MSPTDGRTADGVLASRPPSLGVIGGGQLGRMFVQAAQRMGYRAGVLERDRRRPGRPGGPLVGRRPRPTTSRPSGPSPSGPRRSRSSSRTSRPRRSAGWPGGRPSGPGWRTVWVSQNRLREKTFLARHGIPLAPWRPVRTEAELAAAVRDARPAP